MDSLQRLPDVATILTGLMVLIDLLCLLLWMNVIPVSQCFGIIAFVLDASKWMAVLRVLYRFHVFWIRCPPCSMQTLLDRLLLSAQLLLSLYLRTTTYDEMSENLLLMVTTCLITLHLLQTSPSFTIKVLTWLTRSWLPVILFLLWICPRAQAMESVGPKLLVGTFNVASIRSASKLLALQSWVGTVNPHVLLLTEVNRLPSQMKTDLFKGFECTWNLSTSSLHVGVVTLV